MSPEKFYNYIRQTTFHTYRPKRFCFSVSKSGAKNQLGSPRKEIKRWLSASRMDE